MHKILILNPDLPTYCGAVKRMLCICLFLAEKFPQSSIEILVYNRNANEDVHANSYVTLADLEKRFGLKINNVRIKKINVANFEPKALCNAINDHFIEQLTVNYDLFINVYYQSRVRGKAKKNLYCCMFPPKKRNLQIKPVDPIEQFLLKFNKAQENEFIASYDCFISNSHYTNQWLKNYWPESINNAVLHSAIDESLVTQADFTIANKKNIILCVGRFCAHGLNKSQLELVEIFVNNYERLKGYELHLVGGLHHTLIDRAYVQFIQQRAKSFPVFIHTNASHEVLIKLYQEAKIFWHAMGFNSDEQLEPEKMEHFGTVTIEAMSFGVIPIVINRGGQKEILEIANCGFLWNNLAECIEATVKVIQDQILCLSEATQAMKSSKNFSLEKFKHTLDTIISKYV